MGTIFTLIHIVAWQNENTYSGVYTCTCCSVAALNINLRLACAVCPLLAAVGMRSAICLTTIQDADIQLLLYVG